MGSLNEVRWIGWVYTAVTLVAVEMDVKVMVTAKPVLTSGRFYLQPGYSQLRGDEQSGWNVTVEGSGLEVRILLSFLGVMNVIAESRLRDVAPSPIVITRAIMIEGTRAGLAVNYESSGITVLVGLNGYVAVVRFGWSYINGEADAK